MRFGASPRGRGNFDGRIFRGLCKRLPEVDAVRVQDFALCGMEDPDVLDWCEREDRVLLTHDVSTMIGFVGEHLARGQARPWVILVPKRIAVGRAVARLERVVLRADSTDFQYPIMYLPE